MNATEVGDLTFPQLIQALNSEQDRSGTLHYLTLQILADSKKPLTERKYGRYQHELIAEDVSGVLRRIVQNWQAAGVYEFIDALNAISVLEYTPVSLSIIKVALSEAAKIGELEFAARRAQEARQV